MKDNANFKYNTHKRSANPSRQGETDPGQTPSTFFGGYLSSLPRSIQPDSSSLEGLQFNRLSTLGYYGQQPPYFLSRHASANFGFTSMGTKAVPGGILPSPLSFGLSESSLRRSRQTLQTEDTRGLKLFFKPLNKKTTRDTVMNSLAHFGMINFLRVPFSQKKRKNLGYGFVVFQSNDLALRMINNDHTVEIDGKILNFEKFDIKKFKNKNAELSPEEDKILLEKIEKCKQPQVLLKPASIAESNSPLDHDHFWKPTSSRYHRRFTLKRIDQCPANFRMNILTSIEAVRR